MNIFEQIKAKSYLIIALLHTLLSIYSDHNIFIPEHLLTKKIYLVIKPVAIITIFIFWWGLFKITKASTSGNVFTKKFIIHFFIYLSIMMFFLVLVWPGIWRYDESVLLMIDVNLMFNRWHHWLTEAYFIWALCILGFPAGIIIVQNIFISAIFSYIVSKCETLFNSRLAWLLYIPYLFPSIIDSNLYPLRASVITHLETLFVMVIFFYFISKEKIKTYMYLYAGIIISVLATWRSEGIYYIVFAPVLILVLLSKQLDLKKVVSMWLSIALCVFGINAVQKLNNPLHQVYQLSMLVGHLSALVNDEATAITAEEQEIIDDVFPSACSKDYLWGFGMVVGDENVRKDATFDKKVSCLQKLYIKLILRNPKTFFQDCWKLFKKTSIITHDVGVLCANTLEAFDQGYADIFCTIMTNPYGNYYFHLPWSVEIRKKVISLLECRHFDNYHEAYPSHLIFYNVLPSALILALFILIGIIKRKKEMFFISAFLLIRFGIVFVAAPVCFVMYYFPTLLSSYVMLIAFLLDKLKAKNKKKFTET